MYDTLIHYSKDGQLQPWLATSWEFTDPTTLELKLRDDVTFTDGAKFDADAVKANFQYAIDHKANMSDQVFLANIASMNVVDPTTIDLTLTQPNPALRTISVRHRGTWRARRRWRLLTASSRSRSVGAVRARHRCQPAAYNYVFTANPDYWAADQDAFPYDKVTLSVITDPTAAKNAASTGEVDALVVQPGTEISGFKQVTSLSGDQAGMTGAWLDMTGTTTKALGDVRVRQALNYAIDRVKLGQAAYQDTAIAVPGVPVPEGDAAYTDELGALYPYDPAKAKQLLADAGYADGFEMTLISLPPADQFAQAIAGQLKEVGVTVNVETHSADLVQAVQSGTRSAGLVLQRLTGDAGQDLANSFDPNTFFNVHHGSAPEVTALLQQAALGERRERPHRPVPAGRGRRCQQLLVHRDPGPEDRHRVRPGRRDRGAAGPRRHPPVRLPPAQLTGSRGWAPAHPRVRPVPPYAGKGSSMTRFVSAGWRSPSPSC